MIKEAYCSYELSKLLKEKGFDESINTWYNMDDNSPEFVEGYIKLSDTDFVANDEDSYSAPTHQMAMAWLREKHNMHVDIDPSEGDWYPCVIELETWSSLTSGKMPICNSYEKAVEVGLKYALENLI